MPSSPCRSTPTPPRIWAARRPEGYRRRYDSEGGLNFLEFNYMLLQAYDFLHVFREYGCTLQAGGNDQWGNITAGADLVRRRRSAEVFGITFPLLATASGEKFGKTAGGAVWLDPARTSPRGGRGCDVGPWPTRSHGGRLDREVCPAGRGRAGRAERLRADRAVAQP